MGDQAGGIEGQPCTLVSAAARKTGISFVCSLPAPVEVKPRSAERSVAAENGAGRWWQTRAAVETRKTYDVGLGR